MDDANRGVTEDELAPGQAERDETTVAATMERFLAGASAAAVFGRPVKDDKGIVIPAAEVTVMFGFGLGAARAAPKEAGADGQGGGGGGYILARPVATLVVTPMGVRQEPIVDVTKIALGLLTAVGVIGGLIWRTRNGREA
jgi:uncharacterized spore protein YtfJ